MTVKFIARVGRRGDSALVLIGEKENQASPYTAYRAFSIDLRTKVKSPVRSKEMEGFWMWRLEKVAHLDSADGTDVLFQFVTCTECESERLLGSFHYSESSRAWELREWSKEDGPWLMIGSDPQYSDDGVYYYDCLHAVRDFTGSGLEGVAIRCQESLAPDIEKPAKRITRDETVLYATQNGKLTRMVMAPASSLSVTVTTALCATRPRSRLCHGQTAAPGRPGKKSP